MSLPILIHHHKPSFKRSRETKCIILSFILCITNGIHQSQHKSCDIYTQLKFHSKVLTCHMWVNVICLFMNENLTMWTYTLLWVKFIQIYPYSTFHPWQKKLLFFEFLKKIIIYIEALMEASITQGPNYI